MAVKDALQEFLEACHCFQPGDDKKFAQIVKRSLELAVVSPPEFRDALSICPGTIPVWGEGAYAPYPAMQRQVVNLIERHARALCCGERPEDTSPLKNSSSHVCISATA